MLKALQNFLPFARRFIIKLMEKVGNKIVEVGSTVNIWRCDSSSSGRRMVD
jgi:hypothetical protein